MTSPWHTRNTAPCGAPPYPGERLRTWITTLLLAALSLPVSAETFFGRVVGVSDGDTITVLDDARQSYKVRLAGIDAPEKRQPFGERSKQALATMVFSRDVRIEWHKEDRYRRIVGQVLVEVSDHGCANRPCPRALDVCLAQIEAGLAWHYRKYEQEQPRDDRLRYGTAEETARARRLGLWLDANPVPPWEWRKR